MSFWCLQFLPKQERKQFNLRYHSSKVEIICFLKKHRLEKINSTLSDLYVLLCKAVMPELGGQGATGPPNIW